MALVGMFKLSVFSEYLLHNMICTGKTGCGKSTTIQLLERFYDATSGQIVSSSSSWNVRKNFKFILFNLVS